MLKAGAVPTQKTPYNQENRLFLSLVSDAGRKFSRDAHKSHAKAHDIRFLRIFCMKPMPNFAIDEALKIM
jgi:hypothetical protein